MKQDLKSQYQDRPFQRSQTLSKLLELTQDRNESCKTVKRVVQS